MKNEEFYKLARPNGWDWFTGKTINYRENVGKEIRCPKFDKKGSLCSQAFIHASRHPNQCFIGAEIPCSAFLVSGKPIKEDNNKCGFEKLFIIRELQPEKIFNWNYAEAKNPVHPFQIDPPHRITKEHLILLKTWALVGDSVWDLVWAYIGSFFPLKRQEWKYTDKIKTKGYPFQSAVDLWKMGLVSSFDGKLWRLHGGKEANILWEGKIK